MIQIINKIGGSMTVKILNMIKTIAVIYVITAIILLGLSFGLYKFNLSEWQIKAMENNDLYFKRINIDGNDVQAYVYDTLICKGKYDNVISSIESDALRTVIYNLYQSSIESGVINISSNNYCSFTP